VPCLEPDTVQALVGGALVGGERVAAEAHLDGCDECRAVVASLIKQSSRDARPAPAAVGLMSTVADRALAETAATEPPRATPGAVPVLAAGTQVGRYRIKATLGAGGMGVVYRAEDPELGRDVALKLLRGDRAGPDEETRLVREGRALARVSHPNVITVHDVGTHDGKVFVAMELVDGTSLRRWLTDRPRSLADVLAALAAAGRGLAAAHDAGLVHRDFKPDNVLVGRDGRVRVTDFGLARRDRPTLEPSPERSEQPRVDVSGELQLTQEGALVGSPAYMAPEQLAGAHVDARSDQFGFCVTLYEALYGTRPFAGRNLFELEDNVSHGRVAPAAAGSRVPAGLRAIALRGLAVRPGDRFPSMEHLIAALGRSRARGLRVIAGIAAALALAAGVGLFADWLARDRQRISARAGFETATAQLDQSLRLKYEAFKTVAEASRTIPLVHDIMGHRDQADFGFGSPEDDRAHLQTLHDGMVSADWLGIIGKASGGVLALSDYKGRLIYTSAAPSVWGNDVQAVPDIARAMTPGLVSAGAIVRGADPALLATGITGGVARPEWVLVFIRQFNAGKAVQGLFLQAIETRTLLEDVAVSDQTLIAIVAPSGDATDTMPRDLVAAGLAAPAGIAEHHHAGRPWFVHAGVVGDLAQQPIASIVMASPIQADGLFPSARLAFTVALVALLAAALSAAFFSRRSARLLGGIAAGADGSDVRV
jgi:hypothetical protein